jgi:glycosyltransferase involved in cell wall biosynthesis
MGFDAGVLRTGIDILARVHAPDVVGVTLSHSAAAAARLLADAHIPTDRWVALPLQPDATMFGLIAASRAAILANGFMQIIEALALGTPAVCVHRGIGMDGFQLDPAFAGLVAFVDDAAAGAERVAAWLDSDPFDPPLREALARERGGLARTADAIERVARRPRRGARMQRRAIEWRRRVVNVALPARKAANGGDAA